MSERTAILVGGPKDGHVIDLSGTGGPLLIPELRSDYLIPTIYRDSGHVIDGAHIYVIEPGWMPPPTMWQAAHYQWFNVFYAATHHGGDPKVSPLVQAFHNAWRTHYPKRMPGETARTSYALDFENSTAPAAGCGGHGPVWPCADAKAMARPFVKARVLDGEGLL